MSKHRKIKEEEREQHLASRNSRQGSLKNVCCSYQETQKQRILANFAGKLDERWKEAHQKEADPSGESV